MVHDNIPCHNDSASCKMRLMIDEAVCIHREHEPVTVTETICPGNEYLCISHKSIHGDNLIFVSCRGVSI